MKFITLILALLLPGAALAGSWGTCTETTETTTTPVLAPGGSICFDPASGDLNSTILKTGQCGTLDVQFFPDQSGSGTAISCVIRSCAYVPISGTLSSNFCNAVRGVTLSGVPPNTELEGFAAEWIYANCSGTIGSETPRVMVHCAKEG